MLTNDSRGQLDVLLVTVGVIAVVGLEWHAVDFFFLLKSQSVLYVVFKVKAREIHSRGSRKRNIFLDKRFLKSYST